MPETLNLVRDGAIVRLTLDRPRVLNALDATMMVELSAAVAEVAAMPEARVLVVRGAGDAFMAGGDIRTFAAALGLPPEARVTEIKAMISRLDGLVLGLRGLPIPVIAGVQGACAGFGMSLVLGCDLAIAADDMVMTLAYCHIGTSPDGGSTWALPRHVGLKRAMEIALLGDRIDAAAAERLGLVNWVAPRAGLDAAVEQLAARLAAGPGQAYARAKRLMYASLTSDVPDQLVREAEAFAECSLTADFAEGVTSFVEKRRPKFTGA